MDQSYVSRCLEFLKTEGEPSYQPLEEMRPDQIVLRAHITHLLTLVKDHVRANKPMMVSYLNNCPVCYYPEGYDVDYDPVVYATFNSNYQSFFSDLLTCNERNEDEYTSDEEICCHKRYAWVIGSANMKKIRSYGQGFSLDTNVDYMNKVLMYTRVD